MDFSVISLVFNSKMKGLLHEKLTIHQWKIIEKKLDFSVNSLVFNSKMWGILHEKINDLSMEN